MATEVENVSPINFPVNCAGIVPLPLFNAYVTVRAIGLHFANRMMFAAELYGAAAAYAVPPVPVAVVYQPANV